MTKKRIRDIEPVHPYKKLHTGSELIVRPRGHLFDWRVPGYNYLGPGNDIDDYDAVDEADEAARRHDIRYGEYSEQGHRPYIEYNDADEDFIHDMDSQPGIIPWLAKKTFQAKKAVLPRMKSKSFYNLQWIGKVLNANLINPRII